MKKSFYFVAGALTVVGVGVLAYKAIKKLASYADCDCGCDCDCGNTNIEVVRGGLVAQDSHRQISCGCWVKEGHNSVNRYSDRK